MDGLQSAMAGLPTSAVYGAAAVLVAGFAGVGSAIGAQAPGKPRPPSLPESPVLNPPLFFSFFLPPSFSPVLLGCVCVGLRHHPCLDTGSLKTVGQGAGVLVGAGAGVFAVLKAQEKRGKAAAIELQNTLADASFDPANLSRSTVNAIGAKYGVNSMPETLTEELKNLYDAYIRAVLVPGADLTWGTPPLPLPPSLPSLSSWGQK